MKKILFLASLLALTSCKQEDHNVTNESTTGVIIAIAMNSPEIEIDHSRVFGDGSTETWEKVVTLGTTLVFDKNDKLVYRRDLTATDIANASIRPIELTVPSVKIGDECDFALVVNRSVPYTVDTKAKLLELTDNDVASNNGTFVEVTTKAMRTNGFIMTGIVSKTIVDGITPVTIILKREVAKVEVKAGTTAAFTAKYGPGTITVNKIIVSQAASDCYTFDRTTAAYGAGAHNFTFTQTASVGKARFYIFEQDAASNGSRVKICIDATYDADGNATTTGDRVDLPYELELTGTSAGKILRNGAYLVDAKINGLTGSDISFTVNISNWETLITQGVDLGK